ncbi:hypothetical protein [Methyloglobulus sp.]|uniref:hypothetical protein n=1 Tax=Methyloglobulus sp. TaxID=2518622 RepID=UPI0039897775
MDDRQDILNDFARRSLRCTADQDYIAARMSFKARLKEPFLWSSLHAIEKYLKSILLFNGVDAIHKNEIKKSNDRLGHDIVSALDRVKGIKGFEFTFTNRSESFISYLNEYGTNRYFVYSSSIGGADLDNLDHTIWHIRRYCFDINIEYSEGIFPYRDKAYFGQYETQPHKYKLRDGREDDLLEKIIKDKSDAYSHLVWHNQYFGQRNKKAINNSIDWFSMENPTEHITYNEFKVLENFIYFSNEEKSYFKRK